MNEIEINRIEVITRRSKFQLEKTSSRLKLVDGLIKALENVDEVVTLLKKCKGISDARSQLSARFDLDETQSTAVAAMPLSRLTVDEMQKLKKEQSVLQSNIDYLAELLESPSKILKEIEKEANEIEKQYGDPRRTSLVRDTGDLSDIDIVPNTPMIITYSTKGYIKRIQPDAFSVQKRGGKGVHGAKMRGDDTMDEILHVMAHDRVLFFSNDGKVFFLRAFQIPQASRTATGTAIAQVLPGLKSRITSIFTLSDDVPFRSILSLSFIFRWTPITSF